MWGTGGGSENSPYNALEDTDGDYLKDSMEATMISGRNYLVQVDPTYVDNWNYGSGFRDCEDACMWEQAWPEQNTYDDVDWANPGEQYGSGYSTP